MKSIVIACLCVAALFASGRDHLVERDDRVTDFILQISSRYDIPQPSFLYQQPYPLKETVLFLEAAQSITGLTQGEKDEVAFLLAWYNGEKRLFGKDGDKGSIYINLDVMGALTLAYEDSVAFAWKGLITPKLNGNLGGFSFYTDFSVWTEQRTDTVWDISSYEPYDGNPFNLFSRETSGSIRSSDSFRGGASWMAKMVRFDFAVDQFTSGPARFNPLIFNASNMPVGFLRMTLDFDFLMYTQSVGLLRSMRDYGKYFHYHRLEVPLIDKKMKLGFNAAMVYGASADSLKTSEVHDDPLQSDYYDIDRNLNPLYLIPFTPFGLIEHYSGDRDNALLSFDMSLRLPTSLYWYFEFLLDDFSNPLTLFSNDFGNKWALTFGGAWYGKLGEKNFNVFAEYTRVEPWVYTHFRGVSHRFTHYGESLGTELGPNSAQINAAVEYQFNQKHTISTHYTNSRTDRSYRGGSVDHIFVTEHHAGLDSTTIADSETKEFLAGSVLVEQRVGVTWEFLPYHLYEMKTTVFYDTYRGVGLSLSGGFQF